MNTSDAVATNAGVKTSDRESGNRSLDSGRVAYFITEYPNVSHAFIRREIQALERQGVDVFRIALRGWDATIYDDCDREEQARTRYVLQGGIGRLLIAMLRVALRSPARFASALALAVKMGWNAERPIPFHLAYLAEACVTLEWLMESGATHVHAHFGNNSAEVVMLVNALGGPTYSFTVHGPREFDRPFYIGLREKMRRAKFVVAITSFCRSQLFRWVEHEYWPKIKVVHCGLEAEFFGTDDRPASAVPQLVCIGRLCEQKGQLLLIEAAAVVAARGLNFKLVLVGGGEMRAEIEALVVRRGLQQKVELTGSVSTARLREEILRARALVLASFAEGLPMVLMEAMALRRPVITTYVAGIPELVKHGESGWLIPAGAVEDLAEVMEEAIVADEERLRTMGEAAYARAVARHSIDKEALKLRELFAQCGGGGVAK